MSSFPSTRAHRQVLLVIEVLGAAGNWALVALVVLLVQTIRARDWSSLMEARGSTSPETPDAGVGDEALTSVEQVPQAALPAFLSLGRPMPAKLLDGQRKAPCERGETSINGACWVEVAREKPPCGDTMFDHDGRCFKVSVDVPRRPTSEEPR